jgi:hypothetical protein
MENVMTLKRDDLWSLEQYAEKRPEFRAEVLEHKKNRNVLIGDHLLLLFEDELTIRYQIQEMLRIEKVFEAEGIQDELDAYNPLIPDGSNLKCSLMIQYHDVDERKRRLAELVGIEDVIWLEFGDSGRVYPISDEDMERDNADKTSAVHFMRYELNEEQVAAARSGVPLVFGVEHTGYPVEDLLVSDAIREALVADFR